MCTLVPAHVRTCTHPGVQTARLSWCLYMDTHTHRWVSTKSRPFRFSTRTNSTLQQLMQSLMQRKRSKTWQWDHGELLVVGEWRGSAPLSSSHTPEGILPENGKNTEERLFSLWSLLQTGAVCVFPTKPLLLSFWERGAQRRRGTKRRQLFPAFPLIWYWDNSVPGVHITWSIKSSMEYVKTSRKKPQKYKTKKSGRKKCIKRKKKAIRSRKHTVPPRVIISKNTIIHSKTPIL